jgi:predicted RNase H-like HicB family nuclease
MSNKNLEYYMNINYPIQIIKDEEEGGYTLLIPKLRGCITCAEDLETGYQMILEAKKLWLEAAIEEGIEIIE